MPVWLGNDGRHFVTELALLLDEHYPDSLATQLTRQGVDAEVVISREDLRGQPETMSF